METPSNYQGVPDVRVPREETPMAREVPISDIIQNSGIHKDWSPILRRCAEFSWTAWKLASSGYRVSSPEGEVTFRVPPGKAGDAKQIERQVTRWLAEQHLKAEGIDADPGEVTEIYPFGGVEGGGDSQLRCETHDATFTSVDGYTTHVAKVHAKMEPEPTEPESVAPEPVQEAQETHQIDPEKVRAALEEEPEAPEKNYRGKPYKRGPYRKGTRMEGWLTRALWSAMRNRTQQEDEGLSTYCQALADIIDPNRHDAPGWGVETRPKEVVREVAKEVMSPEGEAALETVKQIREILGADPATMAALKDQIESARAAAALAQSEAASLRDSLSAIVGLSRDVLEGES
jgi:hypothetical protein